jgi:hypothetical protein
MKEYGCGRSEYEGEDNADRDGIFRFGRKWRMTSVDGLTVSSRGSRSRHFFSSGEFYG